MCGLFKLDIWHEAHKIDCKTIFAKSLRGACAIAGKMVQQHIAVNDVTFVVVRSQTHVESKKRRFYEDGKPISPWFSFEEAIDDV